jgi:cytochrome c553
MRSERYGVLAFAVRALHWVRLALATFATLASLVAGAGVASPEPPAATMCAACHGEAGRSVAPTFPNLAGQQAEFLQKQLTDFAKGRRMNEVMTAALAQVPSSDFPILVAYYSAQAPVPGKNGDVALAAAGRKLFEDGDWPAGIPPCRSCHGEHGAGSERYPRLAGQNPSYTLKQLTDFRAGARHNDTRRVMREVASRLNDAQIKALAEYLATLDPN